MCSSAPSVFIQFSKTIFAWSVSLPVLYVHLLILVWDVLRSITFTKINVQDHARKDTSLN